jgi:two-component system NtrC family sensor kinase
VSLAEVVESVDRSRGTRVWLALRWFLILATALLLAPPGTARRLETFEIVILLVFAASNVALTMLRGTTYGARRLEFLVVIADTFLISLALFHTGVEQSHLPLVFFITLILAVLGASLPRTTAGVTLMAALYLYLTWRGPSAGVEMIGVLMRLPFLYVAALYYGHLVIEAREEQSRVGRVEKEKRELETLVDVTNATTSTLELREVLYVIVSRIAVLVNALRCSILTVDEASRRCQVLASSDDPDVHGLLISLDKYPEICRVIETRRAVVINDVHVEPLLIEVRDKLQNLGFESIMVLPLLYGDNLLGMLVLRAARSEERFTEQEIAACQVIANASANALKNAMLFDEMRREARSRRETADKLQNVLDHFPDLIYTTDLTGRLTEFSRGGEGMLGHRRGAVLGIPWSDLYPEDDARARLRRVEESGLPQSAFETTARCQDGSVLEVLVSVAPLRDHGGEISGTVGIIKNITDLKGAQRNLVQAEKLSAIGEVVSGVAHELNNPLAGVLGFAQLLMGKGMDAGQKRSVDRILESALRCQKIVQNLLAFSRRHPSEKECLSLNRLVEKALDLKAYQLKVNNLQVVKKLDPDLPKTMLDGNQIQQVLLNVINNAQHAMVHHRGYGTLTVTATLRSGRIVLEVADDGPGMRSEILGRIFDPFFTTKPVGEGTGLGLSVSYGIVKDHGGRIWGTSIPGTGTTIHIELPIHAGTSSETSAVKRRDRVSIPDGRSLRVLAVDDEPVLLELITDALSRDGHEVETASGGEEALERIEGRDFDVLILDLKMPDMDGQALFEEIRRRRPDLSERVVFASGDTLHPETRRFIDDSGRSCVDKPFELEVLKRAVVSVVVSRGARRRAGSGRA